LSSTVKYYWPKEESRREINKQIKKNERERENRTDKENGIRLVSSSHHYGANSMSSAHGIQGTRETQGTQGSRRRRHRST